MTHEQRCETQEGSLQPDWRRGLRAVRSRPGVSRARQRFRPFFFTRFALCYHESKAERSRLQTMRNFIRNPNTDNDLIQSLFVVKKKKLINVSTEKRVAAKGVNELSPRIHTYPMVFMLLNIYIHSILVITLYDTCNTSGNVFVWLCNKIIRFQYKFMLYGIIS